jgi:hypothetical protein
MGTHTSIETLPGGALGSLILSESDAKSVIEALKRRIRRLTWLEDTDESSYLEMMRASRMCYELSQGGNLTSLDREDVDVLYDLHDVERILLEPLNTIRPHVRSGLSTTPVAADRVMKGISDLFAR